MLRLGTLFAAFTLVCSILCAQGAQDADSTPPAIVSTSPEALANDVDPTLDKITVTFDRPMTDRSWSWTGGGETYPELTGKPSYDEEKTTCTVPAKLEPGKVYWVGINSPSHQNFKSAEGTPAKWHIILFATKSADGKPTPLPREMLTRARQINGPMKKVAATKPSPEQKAAVEAAEEWLKLVDGADYLKMWETLDPIAQELTTQEAFTAQVSAVRGAMGPLITRAFSSAKHETSLPGAPDGSYYILQFNSSFKSKKQGVETVVMKETDGESKVSGYFVK